MQLLPYPVEVRRRAGGYELPARSAVWFPADLPRDTVLLPLAGRLQAAARAVGAQWDLVTGPSRHPALSLRLRPEAEAALPPGGYRLEIGARGIVLGYREVAGLRAGVATLRQLLRQFGRHLPAVRIRDWPDFPRRGVMLDVSRGRVPNLPTLLELVEHLADFKINEFQLYTEHTFAYRNYEGVWRDWGALSGEDILRLDARCRELGIDLVPNQNSFGHLRSWLAHPPLRKLAETPRPWPDQGGAFLRYPATLAPTHPGTLPFLHGLYDELLPHFTSEWFNVGCDETWDLGRGRSKEACARRGKGRVYLDFLLKIHAAVQARGRRMMFWGDIILHHPELVAELPPDVTALNWGYEAGHPFEREAAVFAESRVPFYVCPGTSTWMTLVGRHDNALVNLRAAAVAGRQCGARGYLNTDWGDGGHPQPLAVSYPMYLAGAALSWRADSFREALLAPVLNRDVYQDPTGNAAAAALALGRAHQHLKYAAPNVTPLGAVIAAPPPEQRELFCRDGLKYYARIPGPRIEAALGEVEVQRDALRQARPGSGGGVLVRELDWAAQMAAHSCRFMLWQQALAAGKNARGTLAMARKNAADLARLDAEFTAAWPLRNLGTPAKCSAFLQWRIADYQAGRLAFPPEVAALERRSTSAD